MNIKKFAALTLSAALALTLSACGSGNTPAPTSQATASPAVAASVPPTESGALPTLRLGVMYSTDVVPLAVLLDQDLDKAQGFELDMQVFQSAKDRDAALQAGALDGVFTDYIGVCIYQNAGLDMKITGVTDGDYLLVAGAESGITTLADAVGGSIAISENTLIEYTLDYILTQNSYQDTDVKKEVVPKIPERLELLRAGQIDLGLLPDPFATLALESGAVRLGSANDFGLYPAVTAFSQTAIDSKKEVLQQFYRAYGQAVDYVNTTPLAEFESIAIQGAGFPEELAGKITLPQFRKDTLPTETELESAILWASQKGLCESSLTPADLLYDLKSR